MGGFNLQAPSLSKLRAALRVQEQFHGGLNEFLWRVCHRKMFPLLGLNAARCLRSCHHRETHAHALKDLVLRPARKPERRNRESRVGEVGSYVWHESGDTDALNFGNSLTPPDRIT